MNEIEIMEAINSVASGDDLGLAVESLLGEGKWIKNAVEGGSDDSKTMLSRQTAMAGGAVGVLTGTATGIKEYRTRKKSGQNVSLKKTVGRHVLRKGAEMAGMGLAAGAAGDLLRHKSMTVSQMPK